MAIFNGRIVGVKVNGYYRSLSNGQGTGVVDVEVPGLMLVQTPALAKLWVGDPVHCQCHFASMYTQVVQC